MSTYWPDFNDLWDYDNLEETENIFRRMLSNGMASGDWLSENGIYLLQLKTQIGRALGRQRRFEEAHQILDEVQQDMAGDDIIEVRYLLERGRAFNSSSRATESLPLFFRAYKLAGEIEADYYAVDALHMLGIASETAEDRRDWNLRAIAFAEDSEDEKAKGWLASLYNNTAWGLFEEEKYEAALDLFQRAQILREEKGDQETINIARWCVAKTLRVMGRVEEALAIQRDLEAEDKRDGFTEEEIGECLLALGQTEAAAFYFKEAYELLSEISWVAEDTERMERIKLLGGVND